MVSTGCRVQESKKTTNKFRHALIGLKEIKSNVNRGHLDLDCAFSQESVD